MMTMVVMIIIIIMEATTKIIIGAKSDHGYLYLAHSTTLGSHGMFELELSSLS